MEEVKPKKAIKKTSVGSKTKTGNSKNSKKEITEVIIPSDPISQLEDPPDSTKDIDVCRKMIQIHQSATSRRIKFDLSFDVVKKLMSYKRCYYTGKEFTENGQLARSFDRKDNSKGYVDGNVVPCTVEFNVKKGNLTKEEIIILYNKVILGE